MIKKTKLPEILISKTRENRMETKVEKTTMEGIDEIQQLHISPWTSINKHGHNKQWEIWINISDKTAYICLQDEEHELVNDSPKAMIIMAIKGHIN